MTTTYPQSAFAAPTESSPALAILKTILIEPFLLMAVSVFWLVVLPFATLFSAAVALYDKINTLKTREVRVVWSYQLGLRAETRPLHS